MVQEAQPGLDFSATHIALPPALRQEINRQKTGILSALEQRNLSSFTQETEKLDAWADDLKVGLEREIKELDRNIKETRTKSEGAELESEIRREWQKLMPETTIKDALIHSNSSFPRRREPS
jgi:hypothetical protein